MTTNTEPMTFEQLAKHLEAPKDFEEHTSEIVGTWDAELEDGSANLPIMFIPQFVNMSDSKKFDKSKPSILIFGKLTRFCSLIDSEGETIIGKPGQLAGVWYKPGMRDVRDCGGVETRIIRNPQKDKDIQKGNDLKGYNINTPGGKSGFLLPVREDRRVESRQRKTVFDQPGVKVEQVTPAAPVTGEIPF